MTAKRMIKALSLAACLSLALTACGNSRAGGGGSAADGSASRGGSMTADGTFRVNADGCPADAKEPLPDGAPIKVGVSMALSGPLAAVGAPNIDGLRAVFAAANEQGGIDGHKIELVVKDDAYDAARATANAQAFTGQEKVFANLLQISNASIAATRPIYEQACVPQLGTISQHKEASDPERHAWTTVTIPPAITEAEAAAEYLAKEKPGGKIMEFRQQVTLGEDWAKTFPDAATKRGLQLLEVQHIAPTETNLDAPAAKLTASGADAVMAEVQGPLCVTLLQSLAKAGFTGKVVLTSACNGAKQFMAPLGKAADGVAALFFQKDPSTPSARTDPGMKQYFDDLAKHQPKADPTVTMTLNGYEAGNLLVHGLRAAAKLEGGLTRVNLMNAAWNIQVERTTFLQPKQSMNGPKDPYIINDVTVQTYDADSGNWEPSGVVFTYSGQ